MRGAALLALAFCAACVDAHAGTTGLSTQQARTAAPGNAVDLAAGAASEGSSLSFMRADAQLSVKNILKEANGGTGAGALTCSGNALTSNGTSQSCSSALTEASITAPTATALTLQGALTSGNAVVVVPNAAQVSGNVFAVRNLANNANLFGVDINGAATVANGLTVTANGISSSGVIAGLTYLANPGSGGYTENNNLTSTWDPRPTPTTSNLIAEAGLQVSATNITATASGTTLQFQASGGNANFGFSGAANTFSMGNTANGGDFNIITSAVNFTNTGTFGVSGPVALASSKNAGCVALNSGTPSTKTVTVTTGTHCVCSEATTGTNNANLKCAVSATTLTITGPNTVTDTICYFCA